MSLKAFLGGAVLGGIVMYIAIFVPLNMGATSYNYGRKASTLEQVKNFLALDPTNMLQFAYAFKGQTLLCPDYAVNLRDNAKAVGLDVRVVIVNFGAGGEGYGHVLNDVLLDNGTLLYIEPQNDDVDVSLKNLLSRSFGKEAEVWYVKEV